jgi:hypothetical protein
VSTASNSCSSWFFYLLHHRIRFCWFGGHQRLGSSTASSSVHAHKLQPLRRTQTTRPAPGSVPVPRVHRLCPAARLLLPFQFTSVHVQERCFYFLVAPFS